MHLTQLRLDPHNAQARRDLADPYDMHRTLVRAFVQNDQDAAPRFLWRLEPGQAWAEPVVLVQSAQAPDWSFLHGLNGYLRPEEGGMASKTFDLTVLLRQPELRFRLAANPTVTRAGKRLGLIGEDAQLAWLQRQGLRLGFELATALVSGSDMVHGRKGSARISLRRVVFEGVLQVTEPSALAQAVAQGIGHGKALGCGLLSLARCR
jgi:CRISPR system Cascade subunit CasE